MCSRPMYVLCIGVVCVFVRAPVVFHRPFGCVFAQRAFGFAAFFAAKYGNWAEVDSLVATAHSMGVGAGTRWLEKLNVMRKRLRK